ncbi:hypothetical protein, partial [Bradyrhizobium uaiense]|uniref:hypothetical protein n=1 Tax=Bradyrhizobium uaiense TaxID=2594946 RepID=UPI0019D5BF01
LQMVPKTRRGPLLKASLPELVEHGRKHAGGPKVSAGTVNKQLEDPNYVPANVTNGSWNPLNWSPSQIPQKVAESLPTTAAA